MPTHFYMVLAAPKSGREEEWLQWHKERHGHDMLKVPGILRLQRFEAAETQPRGPSPWRYMALYEIDTDDLGAVMAEVKKRFGTAQMPKTDASDPGKGMSIAWAPLSPAAATALMEGANVTP